MSKKEFISVNVKDDDDKILEVVNIYVQKPTNSVLSGADKHKAKVWNQCLSEGILTKIELSKLMRKRGLWDEARDEEQSEIVQQITDLEKDLYLGSGDKKRTLSEGKDIAIEIRRARLRLRELISERINLEENTAESIADNARFDFIVSSCTFHENGERVYDSIEDYNNRSSDDIAAEAASKLANILYNLDRDFEKNLPENKWLDNFGLVDESLHIVNKEKHRLIL